MRAVSDREGDSNNMASEQYSFKHITPALRIFSGDRSLESLARELDRLGCQRALIFCGSSLQREETVLSQIRETLGQRCAGVFAGVRAHSPVTVVKAAAAELERLQADAAIAVGGGSAIVTARAASILSSEGRDPGELCTRMDDSGKLISPRLNAPKIPQFILPTTPTTAIVKAGSAIFDTKSGERLALFDPKTRAHAVFLHPDLVSSAPRDLVVSASLNTLVMAIEGLMSVNGDPLADALLIHALRLLVTALQEGIESDVNVRMELVLAAVLCGQGSDFTGAGATTVLGHAVGARCGTENGITNAIMLPHVMRFNRGSIDSGLYKLSGALDLPRPDSGKHFSILMEKIQKMLADLGVPDRLRDIKVQHDLLGEIAEAAMSDWFLQGNPRPISAPSQLLSILEEAW